MRMYNYDEKIKEFIAENFKPASAIDANVKLTTKSFLLFLWNAFPEDCISDYVLVDILEQLGYKQTMYIVEIKTVTGTKSEKKIHIEKKLTLGWCLSCSFDLEEQIVNE